MVQPLPFIPDLGTKWNTIVQKNSLRAPFFTFEWHNLWYTLLANEWQPYPLFVNQTLAPFARNGSELIFSGGYEIADYLDSIGPDEAKEDAWPELVEYVKNNGIKKIHLRNIPDHSKTLQFFQTYGATIVLEDTTPIISLPDTWESYKLTLEKKYRHELERKLRKFEREHADFAMHESTQPQKDIDVLISLMQKDVQKRSFLTPKIITFFQKMAQTFSSSISLLLLYIDGDPAAATLSFVSDGNYLLYNSGFDKKCCQNAGFYLKAQSIRGAIRKGFNSYNFLQGSERYKYELGGKDFGVFEITAVL